MKKIYLNTLNVLWFCSIAFVLCSCTTQSKREQFAAIHTKKIPLIDGLATDVCWQQAKWYPIDQLWLGKPLKQGDFEGRYKVAWSSQDNKIYMLVEIKDDVLMDIHEDPLSLYWDDDCLEVFLDENNSGGNHQYNNNAFAYHIATNYKVADINLDKKEVLYTHHVQTRRSKKGNTYLWELAITVYDDSYRDDSDNNQPVQLERGKKMGFMVAYCDNDYSQQRESFIGSVEIKGEDKNVGWIDAGVFGELELK